VPLLALAIAALLAFGLTGCATISNFDQNTYNACMELKADAVSVMGNPSPSRVDDVAARLAAQVAYEEGKGKANTISYQQWKLLARPDGHLLGGWITEYRAGKVFSPIYVHEKQQQVGAAFDEILKLEGRKLR
jgi:hypothetical protein